MLPSFGAEGACWQRPAPPGTPPGQGLVAQVLPTHTAGQRQRRASCGRSARAGGGASAGGGVRAHRLSITTGSCRAAGRGAVPVPRRVPARVQPRCGTAPPRTHRHRFRPTRTRITLLIAMWSRLTLLHPKHGHTRHTTRRTAHTTHKLVVGRRHVGIINVRPVGNYAIQ